MEVEIEEVWRLEERGNGLGGHTLESEGYGLLKLLELFGQSKVPLRRGDAWSRHCCMK